MIVSEIKKVIICDQSRSASRYVYNNTINIADDLKDLATYHHSVLELLRNNLIGVSRDDIINICSKLHPTFSDVASKINNPLSRYECIVIVRNPINRYVSGWKKLQDRKHAVGISSDTIDFASFINKVKTNIEIPWHFGRKLSEWFLDENNNKLKVTALDFNNLKMDVSALITRYGGTVLPSIDDVVNSSPYFSSTALSYENWMTQETYDLLVSYLSDDIMFYESLGFTMPTLVNP